jgi:hypothetical protein
MESQLTGTWELDFKGSESPDDVLGFMGMTRSEINITYDN